MNAKSSDIYPTAMSISGVSPDISRSKCSTTKDNFINQAHEARQARELARRKESAATKIQALFRAIRDRNALKKETIELIESFQQNLVHSDQGESEQASASEVYKDKDKEEDEDEEDKSGHQPPSGPVSLDECCRMLKLSLFHCNIRTDRRLFNCILKLLLNKKFCESDFFSTFYQDRIRLDISKKLLDVCQFILSQDEKHKLSFQDLDLYIHFISLITDTSPWIETIKSGANTHDSTNLDGKETATKRDVIGITADLFSFIPHAQAAHREISSILYNRSGKVDLEYLPNVLLEYSKHTIRLMELLEFKYNYPVCSPTSMKPDMIDLIYQYMCIPGLTSNQSHCSPDCIGVLSRHSFLRKSIDTLLSDQEFQKSTHTSLLFVLGNIIHLAYLDMDRVNVVSFSTLVTKLINACGRFSSNKATKSKAVRTDQSYDPILGWLPRDSDSLTNRLSVKSQLSYLWNPKFVKVLFADLHNSRRLCNNEKDVNSASSMKRFFDNSKPIDSPRTRRLTTLRKVAERWTSNVARNINVPYPKNASSNDDSSNHKLISPDCSKIAIVCCMYNSVAKSLTRLRQDLITSLCMDDMLLKNLWLFISSFGPNNGVKAFLDHLAIYTKTSSLEFHILTLFCQCCSHIVTILDDSELYEKQKPFSIEELVAISTFLNTFVFKTIWNNLIPNVNSLCSDPLFNAAHSLLTNLYRRDSRRQFTPKDHWLVKEIRISTFLKDLEAGKPTAKAIIGLIPHAIPHKERIVIFRKLVAKDKAKHFGGPSTLITIHRTRIIENGYQQLVRLPPNALKGLIRVKFINDRGLDEAGIDQDGVFKEFLEDTIKRVFDPTLNLFSSTSDQCLYPSPTSKMHDDHLSLFEFVGKMLGKAVYEGIVVDVPFASFFLNRVFGQQVNQLYSPMDELPSLDAELYKSLTYIKHYEGDVKELDLTFSIDQDYGGYIETHDLEPDGRSIPVTKETRIRYIHSVANYRMKTQIEKQTKAFISGFKTLIEPNWLSMFSAPEFQRLISGDNTPINLQDLRKNTKYFGGFHNNHRIVCWLWDILEKDFTNEELRLFLKFVTSCSKPPLLGFANLEPPFSIRCVEVSDDQDPGDTVVSVLRGFFAIRRSDPVDRLPTSSTCFNLLKLPNYQRRSTLREKLRYAIKSNSGFELS